MRFKDAAPTTIQQQIQTIHSQVRTDLRKRLLKLPAQKFEELIRTLLEVITSCRKQVLI